MKIYESQLDKLIKHYLVIEFKERGVDGMNISNFLPLCATLIYPFKNEIIENDKKGTKTIMPIVNSVKSFTKKTKGLENYTIDGLRKYFQHNWLPYLPHDEQVRLINCISLISQVEDNGTFSITDNEKVREAFLKIDILDISNNYGSEMFEDNLASEAMANKVVDLEDRNIDSDAGTAFLNPIKEFLYTNFPLKQYPNGLKQYDYFWQYKLNSNQYEDLKKIIKDLNLAQHLKLLKKEISGYGTIALAVVLYISEWYKRESPSLDGDKCLETIGLTSANSLNIWKKANLPEELLHQDEEGNQMRQTAMCALGGLPLYYVVKERPDRFNKFVNGLFILKNKEEDITDEDIESIVDCFDDNNRQFKRSLKSGSCKEYLIQLVDYLESGRTEDLPFAGSDTRNTSFSDFIRILQEGYDEALPSNFFQKEIRIWTYDYMEDGDDSNLIESEFYVHIGFLKNYNVITTRELSKLGIMLPQEASMFDTRLKITLKDGSSSITDEKRTYHKIGNHCDDFCGAFGSSLATSIDLFKTKDIALLIECGDYCKEIHLYTIPSYLELYATDNGFLWTTKTNNAARKVLFYDKYIYTPQNEGDLDILTKSDDENVWGWIYLKEVINLLDSDNKMVTVGLGESELIMVDFRINSLKNNIEISFDGCVSSVIDGEPGSPVHLLYYSNDQELMLKCDGMKGLELVNNYVIEFKKLDSNRYSEWTDDNHPSQGFLTLRIRCRDVSKKKRIWRGNVYFIPKTNIVRRNITDHYISIEGNDVYPIEDSLLDSFNPQENIFKDSRDLGLQSPTISFRIGDNKNHVIIKVYRAFKWQQIWNKDKVIKDVIEGNNLPVAIILQKNIKIKVVDENGFNEYTPDFCDYYNFFNDPKKNEFLEYYQVHRGLIATPQIPYQSYVYLSRFEDISQGIEKIRKIVKYDYFITLNVSNKHIDEYVFFYWSGKMEDIPVKLERTELEDKKYKYDFPSPLTDKAIVFQSIRNCNPNMYFRPFYYDKLQWDKYINIYNTVSIEYLLKCYSYAVEHNIYFFIFPALRRLQDRDCFTEFIRTFIQKNNYNLSNKDLKDLTRLAIELAMDWFFINRQILFSELDEECKQKMRDCMKKLLLCSPIERREHAYSKIFIDRFLQSNRLFNVRDGRLPRKFLKALDRFNDYDGCENTQNRIDLLNRLVSTDVNFFQEICNILNK